MDKNKNQSGGGENQNTDNNGGGGEKTKEEPIITVVLQLDMHCEGCAKKIKKYITSFQGVEMVKGGDRELTKLTVIGKVDPAKLREAIEKKVKKKVELISTSPSKKENKNNNFVGGKKGGSVGEKKCDCRGDDNSNKKGEKKAEDNKKAKEPPVTTAVMKVYLHCQGCIQKIKKTVTKTKGYMDMTIDEEKDQITVKGAIDMKALAQSLSVKINQKVEIVLPKKEGEKKGGENEKEKDSEKEKKDSGKGKGGGGGDNSGRGNENLIHYVQYEYPNPAVFGYGYGYPVEQLHEPGMFSDENPNACSVM